MVCPEKQLLPKLLQYVIQASGLLVPYFPEMESSQAEAWLQVEVALVLVWVVLCGVVSSVAVVHQLVMVLVQRTAELLVVAILPQFALVV